LRILFTFCIFLLYGTAPGLTQDCQCTISDVENNTVTACERIIGEIITVSTAEELREAINQTNNAGGNKTILIADGTYHIATTAWYPYITASNVIFRSLSGNRDAVIITGSGMSSVAPLTENGFYAVGDNITFADLTIKDVGNHGIAADGDNLYVHNVKIQNTYEQMIKGTSAGDGSDNGIVQCSLFEYPAGIGPQWYIGGLDIHKGDNWLVRDNVFKNIVSPSEAVAEHAVHFWISSANNIVERNWIINCDRGIGFGLGSESNDGGIIRNNMIHNDGTGLYSDVGIGLETSPNTQVYNNTVHVAHQNAIEYRFEETNNVIITNNLTNKPITSRNNGEAILTSNNTNSEADWYDNIYEGNLRISKIIPTVTDQGTSLPTLVAMDMDKTTRPQGAAYDIGATEFVQTVATENQAPSLSDITLVPNPSVEAFTISTDLRLIFDVSIYNQLGEQIVSFENVKLTSGLQVDSAEWAAGIYSCRISDNRGYTLTKRILISK